MANPRLSLQPMLQGVKNWLFRKGEDADGGEAARAARTTIDKTDLDPQAAMVETRSGRHASPGTTSTSGTPASSAKSRTRKQTKPKESSPVIPLEKSDQVAATDLLIPSSLADGNSTAHQDALPIGESSSTLPHRSRAAGAGDMEIVEESQPLSESTEIVYETQDLDHEAPKHETPKQDTKPLQQSAEPASSIWSAEIAALGPSTYISPVSNGVKRKRGDEVEQSTDRVAPAAKHKRFASEEPMLELSEGPLEANGPQATVGNKDEESDNDDTDDEAPEEVTAEAGAQEARSKAAKTSQAIKSLEEAARARRQKRDQNLRAQAQASQKRKVLIEADQDAPETSLPDSLLASTLMNDDDLPDELPDSILRHEASQPSPTYDKHLIAKPNKRRRLDQDSKPVKDLKIGSTSIRVLPQTNLSLAPPSTHKSTNIKEAWLKARTQESAKKIAGYRVKGAGARSFVRR